MTIKAVFIICRKCGRKRPEGEVFCSYCLHPLEKKPGSLYVEREKK